MQFEVSFEVVRRPGYFTTSLATSLVSGHSTKFKMAAPVGVVGRFRFGLKSSQILLFSRSFASKRRRREPKVNLKRYDNVYLMNYRKPPKHTFTEALGALRAYNISLTDTNDQIVELYVWVDMGEKKVGVFNFF